MRVFSIIFTAFATIIVTGCSGRNKVTVEPQHIDPLYDAVYSFADLDSAAQDSVMHTDSAALSAMLQYVGADSLTRASLDVWSRSMPVRIFTPDVDSVFPTLEPLETSLARILAHARADSLALPSRSYAAVVWGNRRSIVTVDTPTDSIMLIALNHYLGSDYPGYAHWPLYMRLEKTPERLPYDLAEALVATRYPFRAEGPTTVLSRIVYEGVLTLAKIRLVPDGNMSLALGYTQKQLQWLSDHEHEIWMSLVERKLLYDTSELTAEKLVSPAPATSVISADAPPRIGRYIGYRIICSYMRQNSTTTLLEMLQPSFYTNDAVLVEAAYDGQ